MKLSNYKTIKEINMPSFIEEIPAKVFEGIKEVYHLCSRGKSKLKKSKKTGKDL